jgi:hypothetical protein
MEALLFGLLLAGGAVAVLGLAINVEIIERIRLLFKKAPPHNGNWSM